MGAAQLRVSGSRKGICAAQAGREEETASRFMLVERLGVWDESGMSTIYDDTGDVVGSVTEEGTVFDSIGDAAGSVTPGGVVYGPSGEAVGTVSEQGSVFDSMGDMAGKVTPDGSVCGLEGEGVGHVSGPQARAGGAALLLILRHKHGIG